MKEALALIRSPKKWKRKPLPEVAENEPSGRRGDTMSSKKAKATKHSVVIRSVHNARVPMPSAAKKEALALIRSPKKK